MIERVQPVGLGLEHLLQHRVLEQLPARQRQRALEELGEVGGVAELLAEAQEEAVHLPADGVAQHLVLPAREEPVDGGARHARRGGDVVDGGLRHPAPRDALVGALEDPKARPSSVQRLHGQRPSSGSSPTVRPGRSRTAFTASSTPGMNDVRS